MKKLRWYTKLRMRFAMWLIQDFFRSYQFHKEANEAALEELRHETWDKINGLATHCVNKREELRQLISAITTPEIDYGKLEDTIDYDRIADHIDGEALAANIEIDVDEIAEHLCRHIRVDFF